MKPNDALHTDNLLEEHRTHLSRCEDRQRDIEHRLAWLGNVRFALAIIILILILFAIVDRLASAWWFLPPLAGFAALSLVTDSVRRKLSNVKQARIYHERAVARIEDRWAGSGLSGEKYLNADHPFASDLDLFGKGSLFERLCLCATAMGRDTLARWLLVPANPEEIRHRQESIRELSGRSGWRERAFLLGSDIRTQIGTTTLEQWGHLPGKPPRRWRMAAPLLVGLTLLALLGWLARLWPPFVIAATLAVQGIFAAMLLQRTQIALNGLDRRARDLLQIAGLLEAIERETFTSSRLRHLQDSLRTEGQPPSQRLRHLGRLIEILEQPRNFVFALIAPFLLWTTQVTLAIESWRRRTGPALGSWLRAIGEMEALLSMAAYAAENPTDQYPDVSEGVAKFEAAQLGHPLLARSRCVANDLHLDVQRRLLIVSGSNMSGKSTLLRAVGINAVLAQMGAPVRARLLRMSRLAIGATLRVQDSLQEGKSRFYAELTRLRKVVDLATGPLPVLFLLDEILHGTNSHERKIGAEAIVKGLLQRDTIGLVTTHDLALTRMADDLQPIAANCHFSDDWIDGDLHFDFTLRDGPVTKSNALALMRAVGLNVD